MPEPEHEVRTQSGKKIVASELQIVGADFDATTRLLEEVDLLEDRKTRRGKRVFHEKVERLDHLSNYERLGESWYENRERTRKEESFLQTLDDVIALPKRRNKLESFGELRKSDQEAVMELATNACVLEALSTEKNPVIYSPLIWNVDPQRLERFLENCSESEFSDLLSKVGRKAGIELSQDDNLSALAISAGILPSFRINSLGGEKVYSFVPYTGRLISNSSEKTILEKAQAIVSCLRYGSEAAVITRIKSPTAIINTLEDNSRDHRIGPHTEIKDQYGMLVKKGIGRVLKMSGSSRYFFRLIESDDNLRALSIAREMLTSGEVVAAKDPKSDDAIHLVTGTINHPMEEVRVAKQKRSARADELSDLVEQIRQF